MKESHENNQRPAGSGHGLQELSAVALLAFGVAFATVALLLPPQGEVADSVCWIFAQCLIYAGSALGLAGYVDVLLRRRQ